MTGAKSVMFAFITTGKTTDSLISPQAFKLVAATGQYLVDVGLMTDVEDKFVTRTVKHFMQGQSKLDNPKIGGEMATGPRNRLYHQFAYFFGQRRQLLKIKLIEIIGRTQVFQIASQAKSPFQV